MSLPVAISGRTSFATSGTGLTIFRESITNASARVMTQDCPALNADHQAPNAVGHCA